MIYAELICGDPNMYCVHTKRYMSLILTGSPIRVTLRQTKSTLVNDMVSGYKMGRYMFLMNLHLGMQHFVV